MSEETIENNGYTYTVQTTGTVTAEGPIKNDPASRSGMSSIHPDGYDSTTDKGHLIAARHGGIAASYNVTSQDSHLNRSTFKAIENAESRLVDNGCTVYTQKTAFVTNPESKPDVYMVNDTVTTPEGTTHNISHSFQNATVAQQEAWEETAAENTMVGLYPDLMYEGLDSNEVQEALAETYGWCTSVRDDYDVSSWSGIPSDNVNGTETAVGTTSDEEADSSEGADSSSDCDSDCGCDY